jgi:hypothetical protein
MRLNLEIDAGIGRGAIWTGDDRAPFTDPRAHLDRVLWHSALDYIRIVETRTFTLNLPEREDIYQATGSYPLFDHGRSGIPFILGSVDVNGEPVAFTGSVPVTMGLNAPRTGPDIYGRWLALGADATSVIVHEYVVGSHAGGPAAQNFYPALSIPITVHVTSKILEGPDVPPPQADLEISGARFALGPIDTDNRYIRRVSNPSRKRLNMARGPTLAVNAWSSPGSTTEWLLAWRWRSGAATQVGRRLATEDRFVPDGHNEAVDIAL